MRSNKFIYLIFLQAMSLLFLYSQSVPPDTTTITKKKNIQWNILFDIHYKNFYGNKYIDPSSSILFWGIDVTDEEFIGNYGGYTKSPTFGGKLGVLLEFPINKKHNLFFNGGLTFVRKKDIYQKSKEGIIKTQSFNSPLKIDITQYCWELPMSVLWKYKKFHFFFGTQLSFLSHTSKTKDFLIPTVFQDIYLTDRRYYHSTTELYLILYPFVRTGYEFVKKHYTFRPFIEAQLGELVTESYYLSIGIILSHH